MEDCITMTTKSTTTTTCFPLCKQRQQQQRHHSFGLYSSAMFIWSLLILLITCQTQIASALNIEKCINPLGMSNGDIPDTAITASSSYDETSVGPEHARIRTERKGGAWCPRRQIKDGVYEYLQIDLGELRVITKVETQGRFGNGKGKEYATFYVLEYQREDDGNWLRFRNRTSAELFTGNSNVYTAVTRDVNPPIIAKRIRFIPYSEPPRTVCMRVEMYGCNWNDSLVSYSMPQGHRRGTEVDLYDFTYDGDVDVNEEGPQPEPPYLRDGLGQLTDGEVGETNFRLDTKKMGIKGYEWVGWKNDSSNTKPVSILFKFASVRNFSRVELHSNNHFTRDVRIFRHAEIFYSIGGDYFSPHTTRVNIQQDDYFENARVVKLRMQNMVGRYVRLDLYFQAKWLMISEVAFISTPAVGNFSEEAPPSTTPTPTPTTTTSKRKTFTDNSGFNYNGLHEVFKKINYTNVNSGAPDPDDIDDNFFNSFGGSAGTGDGFGASFAGADKHIDNAVDGAARNLDAGETVDKVSDAAGDDGDADGDGVDGSDSVDGVDGTGVDGEDTSLTEKENKESNDDYISIIIGALAALIVLLVCIILAYFCRQKRRKNNNNHRRGHKPVSNNHVTVNFNDLRGTTNGKVSNGNMYNSIAADDADSDRDGGGSGVGGCCNTGASGSSGEKMIGSGSEHRDYAVPDITKSALVVNLPPRSSTATAPPPPTTTKLSIMDKPPNYDALYAAADIVNVHGSSITCMQGVSGNNVYSVPNADLLCSIDYSVMELRREDLRFVEVLGEGQFGEVHLCEALHVEDLLVDEYIMNVNVPRSPLLVAVKMLRPNADDRARADFHKEIKIMSQLKDLNIVRVLGVCTQEEPLCMVVEYMKYGDLNQFLIDHEPESPVAQATNTKTLSYGCLIYIASQIASGMKYLESLNMVHRDLATRNCLVGHHFLIKISDFGMSRSLYSCDYYRIEGRAVLPIRWMAWESILLGKFTTKSDVWSFAITLWEVLTFAREQPFMALSDEQVIENAGHCYRDDKLETVLPMPINCPKEIYDLMLECWNRQESIRPTFREIHMFLQRKNMGYNPADEKLAQLEVPIC